jgi:hypothetical protein
MAEPVDDPTIPPGDAQEAIATPQPFIPPHIRELLGPPPLLPFEDFDAYERVLNQMAQAVAPQDFVEWTWLRDIVDLGWEIGRARRAKVLRLRIACLPAISNHLRNMNLRGPPGEDVAGQIMWLIESAAEDERRKAESMAHSEGKTPGEDGESTVHEDDSDPSINLVSEFLKSIRLTKEAILDAAYQLALEDLEVLQRVIDNAVGRRNAILREIDRRRDALSRRMRGAVPSLDDAVDAEFENVSLPS